VPEQNHFPAPVLLTDADGVRPAGFYIIENKDKTHDNLSFIAYRPLLRLDDFFTRQPRISAHIPTNLKRPIFHSII